MSERHGIERIRWLLEIDREFIERHNDVYPNAKYPEPAVYPHRWELKDQREVAVECTAALIETLQPWLDAMAQPRIILHANPPIE